MTTAFIVFAVWAIGAIAFLIYFLKTFEWELDLDEDRGGKLHAYPIIPFAPAVIVSVIWPIVLFLFSLVLADRYFLKGRILRRLDSWW